MEHQPITSILAVVALIVGLCALTDSDPKSGRRLAAIALPSAALGFVIPDVGFYVLAVEATFVVIMIATFLIGATPGRR